jgi:hypothetical protein
MKKWDIICLSITGVGILIGAMLFLFAFLTGCADKGTNPLSDIVDNSILYRHTDVPLIDWDGRIVHGHGVDLWTFSDGVYTYERHLFERPSVAVRLPEAIKKFAWFRGTYEVSGETMGGYLINFKRDPSPASGAYSRENGQKVDVEADWFQIWFTPIFDAVRVGETLYQKIERTEENLTLVREGKI